MDSIFSKQANMETDFFNDDPFAVIHNRDGAIHPGEVEEGAFGRAGQDHSVVAFNCLGFVRLDDHVRHRLCTETQGGC